MKEIPENYTEIYKDMEKIVELGFPAPNDILNNDLNLFLGGTRVWEIPWILDNLDIPAKDEKAKTRILHKCLDIGCGTSVWPIYLAALGYDVTAIDSRFKDKNLDKFMKYLKKQVLPRIDITGKLTYGSDDMTTMKFKQPVYDFATCINVLDNVPLETAIAGIKAAAKALNNGAPLFVTMGDIHKYFSSDSIETYFKKIQAVKGIHLKGYKKPVSLKKYLQDNKTNKAEHWDNNDIFGFVLIKSKK